MRYIEQLTYAKEDWMFLIMPVGQGYVLETCKHVLSMKNIDIYLWILACHHMFWSGAATEHCRGVEDAS